MKALENKLLNIKNELTDKVTEKNKVEGQLESVTKSILAKCKCKSIDTARKQLEKTGTILNKKEKELKEAVLELEQDFYETVGEE